MITARQKAFFETFGYLALPGALADDIAWISDEFDAVWRERVDVTHDGSKRTMFPGLFVAQRPRLSTLIEHPMIEDICSSLLGPGYGLNGGDGNLYSGDTGWHSDCGGDEWRWKTIARHLKIAFYLDPVTADTGALRVIPGSHHGGDAYAALLERALPHVASDSVLRLEGPSVPAVALETIPGDLVVFDHRIKHAAFGGGRKRRMFTTNWIAGASTDEQREAVLAMFRIYRDHHGADWRLDPEWVSSAPAKRRQHLLQMLEYGDLVRREKQPAAT
jgi:hypothetical protein